MNFSCADSQDVFSLIFSSVGTQNSLLLFHLFWKSATFWKSAFKWFIREFIQITFSLHLLSSVKSMKKEQGVFHLIETNENFLPDWDQTQKIWINIEYLLVNFEQNSFLTSPSSIIILYYKFSDTSKIYTIRNFKHSFKQS